MKKLTSLFTLGLLMFGLFGNQAVWAAASSSVTCGTGKWKSVLDVNVTTYSQQAHVTRGSVAGLVDAHEKGCEMRVQYKYRYRDDNGFERKGNRMYNCSITAAPVLNEGTSSLDCYSPLWFGATEGSGLKMWAEVVHFGQLEEFPNEVSVGVTLYEANKDVQGVTEFFPSTASGSVKVFVRK